MAKIDDFVATHKGLRWDKYGTKRPGDYAAGSGESFAGQCVSLIKTYLYYLFGPKMVADSYGNAIDYWRNRGTNGILKLCDAVQTPRNGDIGISAGGDPTLGHIFIYYNGMAFAQNVAGHGIAQLTPLNLQGYPIYGYLRPKEIVAQTVTTPVTATKPAPKPKPFVPVTKGKQGAVYRLYHAGDHLYTQNYEEANSLKKAGWEDEGIAWTAPAKGDPVYRLYNPKSGKHHFTLSGGEKATLVKAGWKDEGTAFLSSGNRVVSRMYCPVDGAHMLTASHAEHNWLIKIGWTCEGEDIRYE